ncbi:MAG TPA: rRNA pseudouridine synthase [Firmicutes bacterium]|nr:rRNA pseudouridine synthase [Bacillota bacterium]
MRLNRYMAECGVASRRKCDELIARCVVKVNGVTVAAPGCKINSREDVVEVMGKIIKPPQKLYLIFNKPRGVLTTMQDPFGRKTVADYLKDIPGRVYPVGRLDYDTEGLLFLTNDGEMAHKLMHPRYRVKKEYLVEASGFIGDDKLAILRKGVLLEDGKTAPAVVRLLERNRAWSKLILVIREGRKRQIRRMLDKVGHPVLRLKRTGIAFLRIKGLEAGGYRFLTAAEIIKLQDM